LICKIKRNWSSKDQKIKLIKDVQNLVGKNKVICALSGGVDSSVVAQLLNKAIGKKKRLKSIYGLSILEATIQFLCRKNISLD